MARMTVSVRVDDYMDATLDEIETQEALDSLPIDYLQKYMAERLDRERRKEGEPTQTDNLYLAWWKSRWGADYPHKAYSEPSEA